MRNIDQLNELPQAIVNTINEKMKKHISTSIQQTMIELTEPVRAIDIEKGYKEEGKFILQIVAAILETPAADAFNLISARSDGTMTLDQRNQGQTLLEQLKVGVDQSESDYNLGEINITLEADDEKNSEKIAYAIRAILYGGAINKDGLESIDKRSFYPQDKVLKDIGQRLTAFFANDIIKNDRDLIKEIEKAFKE